jgi:two-component system nitrate/nitrite sensor histidine kinase NarX
MNLPNTWRILRRAGILPTFLLLAATLTSLIPLAFWSLLTAAGRQSLPLFILFITVLALSAFIALWIRLHRQLFRPLARLESSVAQVNQGEPDAAIPQEGSGVLNKLVTDISSLTDELTHLYEDMDNRVARHTSRLAQKTASLKILYDVAASINQSDNLDELLLRFLRILKEMINGLAATVRLVQPDDQMRLVGSIGLDDSILSEHQMLPLDLCMCGAALSPGDILCNRQNQHCSKQLGRKMFGQDQVDLISVTLDHHDEVLGLYHIYVRKPGIAAREDIIDILQTIGSHLGMAIAKQRSDQDAHRLSIVEERTALAHELHDSLAQTLAGLRFQVRLLQDGIKKGDPNTLLTDVQRLSNGLDEAHTELRDLLHGFRAPPDQLGLVNGLRKIVERFQQETKIHSLFQQGCRDPGLSPTDEMQILRIAQECLANTRKHAEAHTVRVMITCHTDGNLMLLVEDDGIGFESVAKMGRPGEHIGLSIMQERARRLGGQLRIESEPGEGTRVELIYKPQHAESHKF